MAANESKDSRYDDQGRSRFEIACYVNGRYLLSQFADDYSQAKRKARTLLSEGDKLLRDATAVTIYGRNGSARRGWYMRGAA